MGLVGESGSGKSTLARAVMGLVPRYRGRVTGGSIAINGRNVTQLPEEERQKLRGSPVAMVFQDPLTFLNPVKKIGKQIAESILLHDRGANVSERVRDLLALVLLPNTCQEAYPHQLSGGMQQRVAIARALAIEPDILLMDEPFSHLDEITARKMRFDLMDILMEAKPTILFVTHDLGEAVFLSDEIYMMSTKPARIFRHVNVDLPRPRQPEDPRLFDLEKELVQEFFAVLEHQTQ